MTRAFAPAQLRQLNVQIEPPHVMIYHTPEVYRQGGMLQQREMMIPTLPRNCLNNDSADTQVSTFLVITTFIREAGKRDRQVRKQEKGVHTSGEARIALTTEASPPLMAVIALPSEESGLIDEW
jgi:hypothetical protein